MACETLDSELQRTALKVGAVVLAAGQGSRLGNRPKCLLTLAGEPLIVRQVRALRAAGVTEIVVVLGHYADVIQSALKGLAVTVVRQSIQGHTQPESVRLGVGALSESLDAFLVTPSDLPLLNEDDYLELISAFARRPDGVHFLGPEVNGQPGNPVIFDTQVREAIEQGQGNFGCGSWRKAGGASVFHWQTTNLGYVTDIDTDHDLVVLKREAGLELVWPSEQVCGL